MSFLTQNTDTWWSVNGTMTAGKTTRNSGVENLPKIKKRRLIYSNIGLHNDDYGALEPSSSLILSFAKLSASVPSS